jgi:hypothetical protein
MGTVNLSRRPKSRPKLSEMLPDLRLDHTVGHQKRLLDDRYFYLIRRYTAILALDEPQRRFAGKSPAGIITLKAPAAAGNFGADLSQGDR